MKASGFQIQLKYTCPQCEFEHVESIDYVNKVCKILCGCGELIELSKINQIKITPEYKPEKEECVEQRTPPKQESKSDLMIEKIVDIEQQIAARPDMIEYELNALMKQKSLLEENLRSILKNGKEQPKKKEDKDSIDKCVSALVSMGWKKNEARSKVKSSLSDWNQSNKPQLSEDNIENFLQHLFLSLT